MIDEQNNSARRMILQKMMQKGEISRAALSAITGLSRSTVTEVVQSLLDAGILHERPGAYEEQRRGRPAIRLALCASYGYFVGVGLSEVRSTMLVSDLRGRTLAECDLPPVTTPEEVVAQVGRAIKPLARAAKIASGSILGLGLAIPGIVDHGSGLCRFSAAFGWRDVPIVDLLRRRLGLPVFASNDADAVAVGQRLFGAARTMENFASILLGRTIGCSHYIGGRLYRGHAGSAGEIGHMTLDPHGAPCRCGKRGCLDTVAGGLAIREKAQAAGCAVEQMSELERLAADGHRTAADLLRAAGEGLGLAIAALVQINNPEIVLLADLEGFGNGLFYAATRQTIENNILPRLLPSTQIVFQPVEYGFLACGAASVAAQAFLMEGNGK
jgi:predicted NBD/HSP70 family sugar kinase